MLSKTVGVAVHEDGTVVFTIQQWDDNNRLLGLDTWICRQSSDQTLPPIVNSTGTEVGQQTPQIKTDADALIARGDALLTASNLAVGVPPPPPNPPSDGSGDLNNPITV